MAHLKMDIIFLDINFASIFREKLNQTESVTRHSKRPQRTRMVNELV